LLAETTRRYRDDPELRRLLGAGGRGGEAAYESGYREHLTRELEGLAEQCSHLAAEERLDRSLAADLDAALAELERQARNLRPVELAPVHGDPNPLNLILTRGERDRLLLVDWDDLLLSDPMRDVSQWLCWYVSQERWSTFFARCRLEPNRALSDRVFWWSARASFANVLWRIARRYPCEVFLRDCWGALRRRVKPHQVFPDL